ncbi:DnaJ domain-containing protein [Photobacterium sanguinicancri]|uniref:DnaJ domain-containing protein n=1 Tax=Photobacterium sanguinicancri TaxID=875932 RepID=UPI00349F3674
MTSFHDILGTTASMSREDIKKRYKMLSNRSHPDKGGSKALMQMVRQAYEQVMKGNGASEAIRTVIKKDGRVDQLQYQLTTLEKIHEELRIVFDESQSKLRKSEAELKHLRSTQSQSINDDYELTQLKRENIRLKREITDLQHDLRAAKSTKPLRSASSELSEDINPNSSFKGASNVFKQAKTTGLTHRRKVWIALVLPLLVIMAMLLPAGEHIQTIIALFDSPAEKVNSQPKIFNTHPDDLAKKNAQQQAAMVMVIPEKPKALPQLKLVKEFGAWHKGYFAETQQPYIAIRSEGGSYVLHNCQGEFQYYMNQNLRSRRLPANLIYERRDRHFTIYSMPYGNGSTLAQWSGSKSLLINDEYFPNQGFENAYQDLLNTCDLVY